MIVGKTVVSFSIISTSFVLRQQHCVKPLPSDDLMSSTIIYHSPNEYFGTPPPPHQHFNTPAIVICTLLSFLNYLLH